MIKMLDLDSLNNAQREAVMHRGGPLLVLAGPGSGKTYTITQRIFYLMEVERIPPGKILVITFTKDAALSMQSRFREQSDQTYPVSFGTFHSVFYHILRESHALNCNKLLTVSQKRNLLFPIIRNYIPQEEQQDRKDTLLEDADQILSAISFFKNTCDESKALEKLPKEWQPHFHAIRKAYEKKRQQERAIDFDDMVCECRSLLSREKPVREYWQGRFDHILIDEFQDINPVQYEVIRLLASDSCSLFAVGDDDQAIYGFRGSEPACLKRFVEDYEAEQICLRINYRSRPEIVLASGSVITENKERFAKQLTASLDRPDIPYDTGKPVSIRAFEEREQQYQYLLARLQEPDYGKTTGILFRTNSYMQGFAARLSREGIPYEMKEKAVSIYGHFIVKDIMAYLRIAQGEDSRALYLQVMNKPSRYISREALGEGTPDYGKMISYYQKKEGDAFRSKVVEAIRLWERQMQQLGNMPLFLAVQYIRKAMGYEKYLRERAGRKSEKMQEWEELLGWLTTDASGYGTVSDWLQAQDAYSGLMEEKKQDRKGEKPLLSLMTVHASKGLEFDRVWIPDCNENIFPHGRMPDEKTCEEERRIFYVAMTRAKESLELLYLTGTKERPRLPSRFLNPLFRDHSSTSSSNSQLSRYSSKASATFSYSSSSSMKSSSGSSLGSSGFS